MSAPEPNAESKIVPMMPSEPSEGQRLLAAIVFTDTVDFSALMSKDEDRARRLVARDLGYMRIACARFDGEVLKSTGDGLLMLFGSAVQAVTCALDIQHHFREENRALPSSERLRHRIGIHLGDVVRQHGDVMGDGVNIASRLQEEGLAGSVCISNTVYEVVQNRVPFYIASRRTQKLKNVGTITVYQISRRQGGYQHFHQAWDWLRSRSPKTVRRIAYSLIALPVCYFFADVQNHHEARARMSELNPLGSMPTFAAEDADDDRDLTPAHPDAAAPVKIAATNEDFYTARFDDMGRYDFRAMSAWLEKHAVPGMDGDRLDRTVLSMQNLFDWCYAHLPAYTSSRPLFLGNGGDDQVWAGSSGEVSWKGGTAAPTALSREQIPPVLMAEMAAQLIAENGSANAPATIQLWRGLNDFIESYGIQLSHRTRKEIESGNPHASSSDDASE